MPPRYLMGYGFWRSRLYIYRHRSRSRCLWLAVLMCLLGLMWGSAPIAVQAAETETELELKPETPPEERDKGNIFNYFFQGIPDMSTERGMLMVDAYWDRNGNSRQDKNESYIKNDIVCRLDNQDYPIPALIPALEYGRQYNLKCRGQQFTPKQKTHRIFIERRGQIINLKIACMRHKLEDAP